MSKYGKKELKCGVVLNLLGMWTVSVDLKKNIEVMGTRIESSIFVKQINGG